jgi:sensor histidine kinase YesM
MKKLFVHNPFFRILTPPVYGLLVYVIILLVNNNVEQILTLISNQEVYVSMGLSLIAFESMRLSIVVLDRLSVAERKRMLLQWPVTTVVAVLTVSFAIRMYYSRVIGFDISMRELMLFGAIFFLTALLYNALYLGNRYILHENKQLLEQEKKLRENLEAEFSTFHREINPSLLYDSLEDLILCMHDEPEVAEELIDSLAALYRYQLVNRHKEFVTLAEELQAIKHLLHLLEARYPGKIHWTASIPDASSMQIMQGALLTTLDSIVRGSLLSARSPLKFTLEVEEDDYLVLNHGLNDKLVIHSESQSAFLQLQRSYSIYSDRPFVQVKAGRENYVKFPLLNVQHPTTVIA